MVELGPLCARGRGAVTRVAAIDCGTNSIRLLVADVDPAIRTLSDVERTMEVVRLGQGVDRTGRFDPAALERTFAACDRYALRLAALAVERVRFVATSATRDAANRAEFVDAVRARLGVEPEVVSGDEEARLSFRGATGELDAGGAPYLVVDIGGGSTEFVLGSEQPVAACSVDVGCVRITERRLSTDPPSAEEVATARADVRGAVALAGRTVPLDTGATLVGLAGSVTTVAAIALRLPTYDADVIHGSRITAADVHRVTDDLLTMTRADRAALPVMHPGRVDVIGAGAMVLDEIVRATGAPEVLVSEHDILDGIAWSLV